MICRHQPPGRFGQGPERTPKPAFRHDGSEPPRPLRKGPEPPEGHVDLSTVFLEGLALVQAEETQRHGTDLTPVFLALVHFIAESISRDLALTIESLPLPDDAEGQRMPRPSLDKEVR